LTLLTQECTVIVIDDSSLRDIQEGFSEEKFCCVISPEDNNGISNHCLPIKGTPAQSESLIFKLRDGELESGASTLRIPGSLISGDNAVLLPAGEAIILGRTSRRELLGSKPLGKTGVKHFLAVRVSARDKDVAANATSISDDIFGTDGDSVNMVSQFAACSYGQLQIIPGPPSDNTDIDRSLLSATGVMDVEVSIGLLDSTSTRSVVRNAITTAVQDKLNLILPGPFDGVMYIVEGCYGEECGWAAYAFVGSWLSVYQGVYYKYAGIQLHEIGHNLALGHSGGLDGQEYTDHTCLVSGYYN
jgi:hypothetical protein